MQRGHEKGVDGSIKECADDGDGNSEQAVQFQRSEHDAQNDVAGDDDAEEDAAFESVCEGSGDEAEEEERGESGGLGNAHPEGGIGDLEHEPTQGELLHPEAHGHGHGGDPQDTEIAESECAERAREEGVNRCPPGSISA